MKKSLAFLAMAALLIPACAHRPAPLAPQTATDKLPVICKLVSRDQTITISASGHGPVYSVQDAKGEMLLSYASREELRIRHPDLSRQLDTMIVSNESRAAVDRVEPLDLPAGSFDRIQPSGLFADGPIMLHAQE